MYITLQYLEEASAYHYVSLIIQNYQYKKLFSSRIGARISEIRKNSIRKNAIQNVRTEFFACWGGSYLLVFVIKNYGCVGGIWIIQTIITLRASILST